MNRRNIRHVLFTFFMVISSGVSTTIAQKPNDTERGEMGFPKLNFPVIDGAPILGRPNMVMGSKRPILTEKHGLAAPAFWDWNADGKKDLHVGEFETGKTGSNIRVYLNQGTATEPKFSDEFQYAKDTKGNLITVYQW